MNIKWIFERISSKFVKKNRIFHLLSYYIPPTQNRNFSEIWYTYTFYIYSAKIVRNQSIEKERKEKKRRESGGEWKTKKLPSFDWPVFQTRGASFSWREAKFSGYENKRTDRRDSYLENRIECWKEYFKRFHSILQWKKEGKKVFFRVVCLFKIPKIQIQTNAEVKSSSSFTIHFVNLIFYLLTFTVNLIDRNTWVSFLKKYTVRLTEFLNESTLTFYPWYGDELRMWSNSNLIRAKEKKGKINATTEGRAKC